MLTDVNVTHELGRHLDVRHGDTLLFRYVYVSDAPQVESPRPYFHPLRTLAGDTVTIFRPHDHLWHHGLSMTFANLSGENFWGGATYVPDRGYAQLDNNGRIDHEAWDRLDPAGPMEERLAWITQAGERWLEERRTIELVDVDTGCEHWTLGLGFELRNVSGRPLEFGSPTTAGRPMAGYGGLFWRGPRSFLGGTILAAGGLEGPDVMGRPAAWLAFVGRHDGSARASTLVLADHPENLRYPNKWFVRTDPYACASWSFMFDETHTLAPDGCLALRYALIVGSGAWPADLIAERASRAAG